MHGSVAPQEPMADLVIIGGGVAGTSLARAAARAGWRVVLLEAARADRLRPDWTGAGASTGPVAFLNPWRGRKGAAHPDDLAGLAAFWRWERELRSEGREPGAFRSGLLRIPTHARQARLWRERAENAPDASRSWRRPDEVPPPYLAPHGALFVRAGGFVRPARWVAALAESARDAGAVLRSGVRVDRIRAARAWTHPSVRWEVHGRDLVSGAPCSVQARTVVLCVGAESAPAVIPNGAPYAGNTESGAVGPSPWERLRGEIIGLSGAPALPWPLAGAIYAGSTRGRTWVGGGHRPAERPDPDAARALRRAFAAQVPGAAAATVVATWSAVRAKAPGTRPVVREAHPGVWTFGAFAGRGFLCAAAEAEAWVARSDPARSPDQTRFST